jgi:DNA integrity scanning protein DisA with diadenylate cyclase activity
VVSEETGSVSYIKNGDFVPFKGTEELIKLIKKDLE